MKILRKNIIGFIVGAIVFGVISYGIASQILAIQVSYTNEKSEANVTSVDGALTELYGLAEECQNASSSGSEITYYGKDAVAVYLDPTGTQTNCSESNYSSTASTGCMRFYVYAEDGEYKYAILDHNTTANFDSSGCENSNCFIKAQSQVKQDTSTWDPNLQARNISAMEVYKITESTNDNPNWQINNGHWFNLNAKNGANGLGYVWLFDKTNSSSIRGYWTSDFRNSTQAWVVYYEGMSSYDGFSLSLYGVRPVIQITK